MYFAILKSVEDGWGTNRINKLKASTTEEAEVEARELAKQFCVNLHHRDCYFDILYGEIVYESRAAHPNSGGRS